MRTKNHTLTQRQQNALWVVSQNTYPITVRDLVYHHLNGDYASCYGVLARLEARGLVERQHTGLFGPHGRYGYAITARGEQALEGYTPPEDDE